MSVMLIADWCPLGRDTYFRKFEMYPMSWPGEVNLDTSVVSGAPYGGPVAVVRDRRKVSKVSTSGKPIISLFSSSGRPLSSIVWSGGPIVQLGWSAEEDLLCVQDDGCVLMYDLSGSYQHTFSMGQEAKDTKIIDAKIFSSANGTGIAVLTSSYRFFIINSVKEPKVRRLPEVPGLNVPPSSWVIISEDRQTTVLIARDKELFLLKQAEQHALAVVPDFNDRVTSVVEMAVSQNNRHVALFTDNCHLWIGSADLRKKYCDFDTKCPNRPKQLVWCGTEAVVGHWDGVLLLVGRQADYISYAVDSALRLIPEIDGVRVISTFSHELLQKVPPVVQKIFRINSTEPGSYLLEASKQFQKRSHRADEYIRLVKDQLETAVRQCIEAAGYEFDPENQKMLIRAAQFGKGFVPNMDSDSYVKMCRTLRVLNAVRDPKIGIPLTYTQLHFLSLQVLLDRLVLRKQYYLAIQIAKYLRLPDVEGSSRILAHWACYKVKQTQLDKEQVARDIADKLGYTPGVSYSEIAMKAADCGRTQLAIKLMDYEPRASLQVPLLLRLGEDKPALVKAIESGDTDLVHTVLLHLRENMPLGEFQMAIRNYPVAQALYIKYCRHHNPETLRDIYIQEDDYNAQAACYIHEFFDPKTGSGREASLKAAQESYRRSRNEFAAGLCEEQQRLLKYQKTMEEKFHCEFVGLSVHDTIQLLLSMPEVKLADKLRAEYRVPDRRYWWLRILSLSKLEDWLELDKFSKSKKSPIGYEPFVDVCLQYGNQREAKKYISKVKDDLKVKYFVKVGMYEEAAQFAYEQKDVQALLFVQGRCASIDKGLSDRINVMAMQLGTKK